MKIIINFVHHNIIYFINLFLCIKKFIIDRIYKKRVIILIMDHRPRQRTNRKMLKRSRRKKIKQSSTNLEKKFYGLILFSKILLILQKIFFSYFFLMQCLISKLTKTGPIKTIQRSLIYFFTHLLTGGD